MFRKPIIRVLIILFASIVVLASLGWAGLKIADKKIVKKKQSGSQIEVKESSEIEKIEAPTAAEEEVTYEEFIQWIKPEDPLLDELKIELELTDEQLQKLEEALDYERKRDFIARSLDYRERNLIYLDEQEKEIQKSNMSEKEKEKWKRWAAEQREKDKNDIKKFEEQYAKLPELTTESLKKIFTTRQLEQLKEWIKVQASLHRSASEIISGKPKTKSETEAEFNKQLEKTKSFYEQAITEEVENSSIQLKIALKLSNDQHQKIKNILKDWKQIILELRSKLTFLSVYGYDKGHYEIQVLLNKITKEKENIDRLINETLTAEQKIKYQRIKEEK